MFSSLAPGAMERPTTSEKVQIPWVSLELVDKWEWVGQSTGGMGTSLSAQAEPTDQLLFVLQ